MRRILKWSGYTLGSLVGLIAILIGAIYVISGSHMSRVYSVAVSPIAVESSPAVVAEGKRQVFIRGCVDCHGENFAGKVMIDHPALGRLAGANLTKGEGGVAGKYKDEDWVRAIRHGVNPEGRPLLVMPSYEYAGISDRDVAAMVAYIKSLPPVDNTPPSNTVRPLGRLLYLLDQLPLIAAEKIDHTVKHVPAVAPAVTIEYGKYMASGCVGCHGNNYAGQPVPGRPPDAPQSANLTPDKATGIGNWTEEDFTRVLKSGVRPDGRKLNPMDMPWNLTARMTDTEIKAMYLYLKTLPPVSKAQKP